MHGRNNPHAPADGQSDDLKSFGFEDSGDAWMDRFQEADVPVLLGSIGPYEVLAEVGRGGQGVVYRARQPGMGRDVAVKRLLAGSFATASMRRRFEREIQAVSALNHPNIVTVFAMDVIDAQPVLAMEWVDGVPLTRWAAGESPGGRDSPAGPGGRRDT
ncbi:MAG: protein kinase, partial [Planctomycetota bacterium]|nr:protein kinase [Planctomycetota bacterium]